MEIDFSARARREDYHTSHAAAARVKRFGATHHAKIIGSLATQGDGTAHELSTRTGIDAVAVNRRLSELAGLKLIERTGDTRLSPTGNKCAVWRLAP